jgi:hypothetical protein
MSENERAATSQVYKSYNSYNRHAPGTYGKTSPVQSEHRKLPLKEKGFKGVFVWLSEPEYDALMDFAREDAAGTAVRKALRKFLAMRKRTKGK